MTGSMDKFNQWFRNRHDYVKDWKKRTGGKVVGYFCSYLPEEIFYAANILPVRIFGGHEASNLVESHISTNIACAFCRDCLGQGLTGKYDYLDGLTMAQTCLHTGQIFWIWSKEIPVEWSRFIAIPHGTQNVGRFEYLTEEMKLLKESIEKWTGKAITDEDMDRATEVYNTNRKLCRQVYEYRKKDNPTVTGEDALNIIVSSQMIDKIGEIYDVKIHETAVGFKYVGQIMRNEDVIVGGEESGGLSIWGHIPEKDGIVANLSILEAVAYEGKPLYEIAEQLKNEIGVHYLNFRLDLHLTEQIKEAAMNMFVTNPPNEVGGMKVKEVNKIDGVKLYFYDNNSWMLVRPSGTEPLLRIYFETDSQEKLDKLTTDTKRIVENI